MGIDKPLHEINFNDVNQLVRSGQDEWSTIEFKANFHDGGDKGKSELAKDLTAFANAEGGDIIIGVREKNSKPGEYEICGVEKNKVGDFIQRITHVAEKTCCPPLKAFDPSPPIDIPEMKDRCILIVRVRPSLAGPHSSKPDLPVYIRQKRENLPINVNELREIMDFQTTLADRAAAWRADRIMRLVTGDFPRKMGMAYFVNPAGLLTNTMNWQRGKQLFIIHLMPLAAFRRAPSVDAVAAWQSNRPRLPVLFGGQHSSSLPFTPMRDGLLACSNPPSEGRGISSYTMLFRSGALELASPNILMRGKVPGLRPDMYSESGPTAITLKECVALFDSLHIQPPILIGFHLSGVGGLQIPSQYGNKISESEGEISSPEYRLDDYSADANALFTEFLNIVANAAGEWQFNRGQ